MSNLLFHITLTNLRKVPQWFNGSFLYQFFTKKELLLPRKQYASLKTKYYKKNQCQQMKVYKKCYVLQEDKISGTKFDY